MCCSQLRELLRQVPACSDGACANGMLMDLGVSSMQVRPRLSVRLAASNEVKEAGCS